MQKPKKLKKYQKPKITVQQLFSKLSNNYWGHDGNPKGQGFIDQFLLAANHCLDGY